MLVLLAARAAGQCYMTSDGAPNADRNRCSSAQRNDAQAASVMQGNANQALAGARCCSTNPTAGPHNSGFESVCASSCEEMTWADARSRCRALGSSWDLCTVNQLATGGGGGSGCDYDGMHVWTRTRCPTNCASDTATHYQPPNDRVLVFEMESLLAPGTNFRWATRTAWSGFTGANYLYYTGPVNGIIPRYRLTTHLELAAAGIHRVMCRGYVDGNDITVRNDVWIRFVGQTVVDLFGVRTLTQNRKRACANGLGPNGRDLTPYSNGCDPRNDGFLKLYNNNGATRVWNWRSKTSDFDARDIYLEVNAPGRITLQMAARSNYALDRCVIYHVDTTLNSTQLEDLQDYATDTSLPETTC